MTKNKNSIKNNVIIIIIEILKLSILLTGIFWTFGILMLFLFIKIMRFSEEGSVIVTVIFSLALTYIIETTRLHADDKIIECNENIVDKLFNNEEVKK